MKPLITLHQFKRLFIWFWAFWWLVACWTDIVGGFAHLGMLTATWAPDKNLPFLETSLKMYAVPSWLPPTFFIGIITWTGLSALAFFIAAFTRDQHAWRRRAITAFIISMLLWLVFFMADQVVMQYALEENHMVQGSFEFLTFLFLLLIPCDTEKR